MVELIERGKRFYYKIHIVTIRQLILIIYWAQMLKPNN